MCGFAGVLSLSGGARRRALDARRGIEAIAHRGPDGDGFYADDRYVVAFRRLAIIDPAGGAQPLFNEDRSICVVVNGEIYNHRSLRRLLAGRGHQLGCASDAEVVAHAYEEWGDACVERFEGMFAVALWDARKRRLLLARDRSGIKPLVFAHVGDELRFASEAKALLAMRGQRRLIDVRGLFDPADEEALSERTAFGGIDQLAAGCLMTADAGGVRTRRYWRYQPRLDDDGRSAAEHGRQFAAAVEAAVASHLISDVPVGTFLSGGVDSSLITAIMRRRMPALTAFTTTSAHAADDDEASARTLAARLGLRGVFVPDPNDAGVAALLPQIAWLAEGDFEAGFVSRLVLAEAARREGVKVVLSGQGIDELLTGYHPSFDQFSLQAASSSVTAFSRALLPVMSGAQRARAVDRVASETLQLRREHAQLSRGLLRFEDRMTMAVGLELRVPFLDRAVVEAAAAIPPRLRRRLLSNKAILRRMAARWLPKQIASRPKLAFNGNRLPLTVSLAGSELLRELMSERTLRTFGYFDPAAIAPLAQTARFDLLDRVLVVQLLHEVFVRSFDIGRSSRTASLLATAAARPLPRQRARSLPGPKTVPTLSRSTTWIRVAHAAGPGRRLQRPQWATVEFAEPKRAPARIPTDGIRVLEWIDGQRSYREIQRKLGRSVALADLLRFGRALSAAGVVDHDGGAS
ncbi:MAG: asnB [bacterium]|nr:asnB [bacterium]